MVCWCMVVDASVGGGLGCFGLVEHRDHSEMRLLAWRRGVIGERVPQVEACRHDVGGPKR